MLSLGTLIVNGVCIAPNALAQSETLFERGEALGQNNSTLIPGVYYRRSYISIHQYGDRICYTGGNIRSSTVASVEADPEQSGVI